VNSPALIRRLALAVILFLGSFHSAFAVTLVPQEQAIANLMASTPGQGRPTLILDPIIEGVARARAQDMAVRNYFSHVNPDGVAANYLLRQAGYVLPAWWGTDPSANYVESIAAGYSDPNDTWNSWMNSPPHKEHLLAQNSFFASETHYGVGYYYDPNSTYQYYWVVITAPPQPIEITTPEPGTVVSTSSIAVAGSADPGTSPATVQFRVENSNGAGPYQVATGLAKWSGTAAGLVSGTNLIRAQSLDGSGNLIAQTTCRVNYAVPGTLTVTVSGSGSVTSALAGVTTQIVGRTLTVKATPASGSIFAGWTGSVTSAHPVLSFTMQDGLDLQANFVPNPFGPVAGGYSGILSSGSGAQTGLLRLSVSPAGFFTGRVQVAGRIWSITGQLDATGAATVTIPHSGTPPLTITIQADLTGGSGQITGSVSGGLGSFGFTLSQSTFNAKTNAAPQAGRYTLVLSPDPSVTGTSVPQGNGYAAIVIAPGGSAVVAGRLADGTPFSATAQVANDGTLAVYTVPSGAPAGSSLEGVLTFEATSASDLDGTLTWIKGPKSADPFYPAGFTTTLPVVGSLYVRPAAGLQAMDVAPGAATAGLGDGNLPQPINVPVTVSRTGRVAMTTPGLPDVALVINSVSGAVTGTFVLPGSGVRAIRGIVFQKQNSAFGYFRGLNQSGYFSLSQN
jgi:hypothetical protein